MKIKTILLFLFVYQFVSGQNCEVFMQKFQKEYQRRTEASWDNISWGSGYDKTKFNEAKVHITRFINCKADEIGFKNEVLTKLKNCIDLIYREDTHLIIAGEYDEKKSLKQSEYSNRYYIINSNLEIVNEYDEIRDYSNSKDNYNKEIYLVKKDTKYGIIDKNGMEVVKPIYDFIYGFNSERSVVINKDKYGAIDFKGNLIIPCIYDGAFNEFSEGYLTVANGAYPNEKFGLIDKQGKEIIALQYEIAGNFFGGLLPVYKNKKWGFVNIKNEIVIPFNFEDIGDHRKYNESGYNKNGIWFFQVQKKYGGKIEYINKKGKTFKLVEDVKD